MARALYYNYETGRVTNYDLSAHTPAAIAAGAIINPDISAVEGQPLSHWKVEDGEVILDIPEPDIAAMKNSLLEQITFEVNNYLTSKYDDAAKLTFSSMLGDSSRPNRKNYVQAYIDWTDAVLQEWLAKSSAITAATTVEELNTVPPYDWATFEASNPDPEIKVWLALSITD